MSLDNKKHFNSGGCSSTNICRELNQKINGRYNGSVNLTTTNPTAILFKSNVSLPISAQIDLSFGPPNTCNIEINFISECGNITETFNGSTTPTGRDSIVLAGLHVTEVFVTCLDCIPGNSCFINYELTIGSNES